jgi:thiol-disulfide isomerase/thioredoxin
MTLRVRTLSLDLTAFALILLTGPGFISGQEPSAKPQSGEGRAEQLKAIQAEYKKALDQILKDLHAGKLKEDAEGGSPDIAALRARFIKRVRAFIDADPKDEAALDAMEFAMGDLVDRDAALYRLVEKYHSANPKIASLVRRGLANEGLLRKVAEKSPDPEVRGTATLALAKRLAGSNHTAEAEKLLEQLLKDKQLAKLHGSAKDVLFDLQHLAVGKVVPEVEGVDLDDKAMKLSDYRGKVVMLVFWATWCGPCMAMIPHERELAKRYAGRPFAIVGVSGTDFEGNAQKAVKEKQISWRSFKDYLLKEKREISRCWNVSGWPTVFVLDHRGVIRLKFSGKPEDTGPLDKLLDDLVKKAEAELKEANKQ